MQTLVWSCDAWLRHGFMSSSYVHVLHQAPVRRVCGDDLERWEDTFINDTNCFKQCMSLALSNIDAFQWRHNGHDGVPNHQPYLCLLNRLSRRRSKKTSKLRVTGLCEGNSPVNSPHKGPVTRKMFPFDDVIMAWKHRTLLIDEALDHSR